MGERSCTDQRHRLIQFKYPNKITHAGFPVHHKSKEAIWKAQKNRTTYRNSKSNMKTTSAANGSRREGVSILIVSRLLTANLSPKSPVRTNRISTRLSMRHTLPSRVGVKRRRPNEAIFC